LKNIAAVGEKLQQEMLSPNKTQIIFVYVIGNYKARSIGVMSIRGVRLLCNCTREAREKYL